MAAQGSTPSTLEATKARAKAFGLSNLLVVGAVAGLVAGFVFILANMLYLITEGKPAVAPVAAIGTVFFFDDKPMMTLNYIVTGVITHFALSILFGVIFAMLVPMFANVRALSVGAFLYGLALYLVNFLVFGSLIFQWFAPGGMGPDQVFELIIHPTAYGLVLIPFFAGMVRRLGSAETARAVSGERGMAGAGMRA